MDPILNIAVMAARRGGDVLIRSINKISKMKIEQKGRNDFVSEADRNAENAIIEVIHKHYPEHAIMAEESGESGDNEHVWIIDPLDGTTNYLHGFPYYCVSIAVKVGGRLQHAAVYDPQRQELFTATRGQGAQVDGRKIRVSGQQELGLALLGTGFPYRDNTIEIDPYLSMLKKALQNSSGIRRAGSAALDLCYVAAGRLDGFWESGLKAWDMAAGALIIREAGGIVTELDGGEHYLDSGHILAGSPKIYTALTRLFKKDIAKALAKP